MNAARHVAVVTPWYPETQLTYQGSFVKAQVEAVAPGCSRLDVYHLRGWPVGEARATLDAVPATVDLHTRLLARSGTRFTTAGGAVLHRIPTLTPRNTAWVVHADATAHWLRAYLGGKPLDAPIVHAHVPITAGWAALENAAPGARVYLTEHASFLDKILAQPAARDRYEEILARADGFFVVGAPLHDRITAEFPQHAGKVEYIANPIDFGSPRTEPPTTLRRWLSVAAMNERKRIDYLLEGFRRCRERHPDLELTIAGEGVGLVRMKALAEDLGLGDAVDFVGAVEPAQVPALMAAHDLFVHTSRHETFGVVVVEALASGMPVLVSRSGGSDQVLEGIESEAGQMFEVDPDPDVLVDAYLELRDRHPEKTDIAAARERLRAKYSYEAVAECHYAVWDREGSR
ncbi:glycosyltransferase [Glycomyces sp. MUSA5-2]|uniref:glycosyltransferase n=1 Tax=Glycomyces sp. MUSA5-2 TaxID=2053002 RepID=UPI00300A1C86